MIVFERKECRLATFEDLQTPNKPIYCFHLDPYTSVYEVVNIQLSAIPMTLMLRNIIPSMRYLGDNYIFTENTDGSFSLLISSDFKLWVKKVETLDWDGDDDQCI